MKTSCSTIRVLAVGMALIASCILPCHGQSEARNITLSVGEIRDLSVSFDIKGFVPGNRDIVRAQAVGAQKLSVTALKEGRTDLKITGDGEQTETFKITVGSSLDAVMSELRKDLDNIPGVEAEVGLGKVVLRGIITKPQDWSYLKKRILPSYGDQVQCKVQFRLQDEMLLKLKSELERAHFKVQEGNKGSSETGVLNLFSSDNNVFINGSVYARGDLDSIRQIVSSCAWLTIRKDGEKADDDVCYAVINVSVTPVTLEVDVCFVGLSDSELTQLGANLLNGTLGFVEGAAGIAGSVIPGTGNRGPEGFSHYVASTEMSGAIRALSAFGPRRFSNVGHMSFRNDAGEWKSYKDGGTEYLKSGGGVGTTSTLTPVEYGFMIKAKGGLTDAENAALDLNVELSLPVGSAYNLKQTRMDTAITCPIGKTVILGGHKELTEGVNIDSTPILGQIPGLQFLFSERTKTKETRQVVTLVSVQLAKAPTSSAPISDQTADTQKKAEQPLSILKPGLK